MKTLQALYKEWSEYNKPMIIDQYGADDEVALSEDWNNFTDAACKDGEITELQYNYCPAHDEAMPDDDVDYLLDQLGLSFNADQVLERPDKLMIDSAVHWRFTFGDNFVGYFSQGKLVAGQPEARDVLECIISDASCVDGCDTFEEFANDMGYDEDSREAERTYFACRDQSKKLHAIMSDDQIDQFRDMIDEL